MQSRPYSYYNNYASYSPTASVEPSKELVGVHIFTIDKPFMVDAQTNYLLPMFRPQIKVERYDSISKSFESRSVSSTGKAQRSYRLTSDQYLMQGK